MKTAERPVMSNETQPRRRGLLSVYSDAQKAVGELFVTSVALPGAMTKIGVEATTDVVVEFGSRKRIVREFYDKEKFHRIVTSSESVPPGDSERYTRYVGKTPYTVDLFPKGVSEEVVAELSAYHLSDLSPEDFYGRFIHLPGDADVHADRVRKIYSNPDVTVMVVREEDKIVGSSIMLPIDATKNTYEFAFDVASDHQAHGLGSMLMRDMLTVCDVKGIHELVMEVDGGNNKSKRRVARLENYKNIPWTPYSDFEDGVLMAKVVYTPQEAKDAA